MAEQPELEGLLNRLERRLLGKVADAKKSKTAAAVLKATRGFDQALRESVEVEQGEGEEKEKEKEKEKERVRRPRKERKGRSKTKKLDREEEEGREGLVPVRDPSITQL